MFLIQLDNFMKVKMELNKNYRITHDAENVILQFHEMREKQILIKGTKDTTGRYEGTGEFKEYSENYYFPSLETALRGFLIKSTWGLETAKEILEKIEEVNKTIKSLNTKN